MAFSNILQTTAWIEAQGSSVLDVMERGTNSITYKVIGFAEPELMIIDYREKVNHCFDQCCSNNDFSHFPYSFSSPADIILQRDEINNLILSLYDATNQIPEQMLWLTVAFEGEYPNYDYTFQNIQKDNESTCSGLTIYPLDPLTMIDYMDMSASDEAAVL